MTDFIRYSYVTVEEADSYFTTRLNSDSWNDSSDTDKQNSLYAGTTAIDALNFNGVKTSTYNTINGINPVTPQPLEWPRNGLTTVPDGIRMACCECAIAFLDGIDIDSEIRRSRLLSQGFASVRQSYRNDIDVDPWILAGIPSYAAWILLLPFLSDPRTIRRIRTS